MSKLRMAVIASIVASAIIVSSIIVIMGGYNIPTIFPSNNLGNGKITIISSLGSLIDNHSEYSISPDPFSKSANYTVQDGGDADENRAEGVIEISQVPQGKYVVTQVNPSSLGYVSDGISKLVQLTNQSKDGIAMFNSNSSFGDEEAKSQLSNTTSTIRSLAYNVKFECGTISGNEGPLRPGHYDTDIGILNKQDFAANIQWSITANNSKNTNSIVKTLDARGSTNIVCKDLRSIIGNEQKFVEGFVIIDVPLEPGLLGSISGGTQVHNLSSENVNNLFEVQAFYTANALDELPHELFVDKIVFTILNATSSNIPQEMVGKTLDVSVPSTISQISDPEMRVKEILTQRYNLSAQDVADLQIAIKSVDASVGAMIDDHAISLSRVMPQVRIG
ncbi:MAG: hypothetical protein M3261_02790 [Thermoproteota archaeon]|nr:hypothetical protein [Thermoproteota archaeon]